VREYRIERILGVGGMGEVYLASHTMTRQNVAMKVISPELMLDKNVRRRFLEEGRVMGKLRHPNIVRLLTFFEEGRRLFLVMDFIDGPNLESILSEKQLPFEEAIRIMRGVLLALDFAHSQADSVVHRDIKPANIMLGRGGSVVVTDFGIAKAAGREKLTRTRGIVGTFEYMSPEQVQGGDVTPASDIYACGITLYHMVTGIVPYPQETEGGFECMQAQVSTPLPSIREFREATPDWLERVIVKSLQKDPALRFSSARAMLDALSEDAEPDADAEPVATRVQPDVPPSPPAWMKGAPDTPVPEPSDSPVVVGLNGAAPRRKQVSLTRVFKGMGIALLAVFGLVIALGIIGSIGKSSRKEEGKKEEKKKTERLPKKEEKKAFIAEEMTEKKAEEMTEKKAEAPEEAELAPLEFDEAIEVDLRKPEEPEPPPEPVVTSLGPKETIDTAIKAIQDKKIEAIVDLFPESYLKDLEKVVRNFSEAMDKEVFDKFVVILDKAVRVCVKHKGKLVQMVAQFGIPASEDDLGRAVVAVDSIWSELKDGGLTELHNLKRFSIKDFGTGELPKLTDKLFALADSSTQKAQIDMTLALLSSVETRIAYGPIDEKWGQVVHLTMTMEGEEEKGDMVKVDDKWVPLEMAQEWDNAMREVQNGLDDMARELPKIKPELMAQLEQVETLLDQAERTGDLSVLMMALGAMGTPAP